MKKHNTFIAVLLFLLVASNILWKMKVDDLRGAFEHQNKQLMALQDDCCPE